MTTNQQLIREEQILEDINYSTFDNSKNNNDEDELKIKINKKEKLIFNIEKDINQLTELYADKNALESLIGDSIETSNSLIEGLEVTPGYEKALDALLGDELYYSLDSANDIYWKKNSIKGKVQSLPKDTQSLSDFVNGSDILNQRLSQTALVSKEKGDILFSELSYGQRMVTKEGDLWRWDGLVVSAGAPGSAAKRLGHRNHLIEIYDSIKNFEKNNGNMEHLRDQLKIEHKNLSDLKLNFEKYQLDKKNILEIEKRSDLAKDQISILKERIKKFEEENNDLDQKPEDVELRKTELNEKISSAKKNSNEDNDNLANIENRLRDLVNEIRTLSDKESLLREKKGRIEVTLETNKIRLSELTDLIKKEHREISVFMDEISVSLNDLNENEIQISIDKLKIERDQLGGVNLKAEDEAKEIKERIDDIKIERNDLVEAIKKLKVGINDLNKEGRERMQRAFFEVNEEFQNVFKKFFGGGNAELKFIDSDDPLEAGLEVFAQLPGKKLIEMSSLSGGEKGLVSLSLIFAVFLTNPSPICVLDEVDAALDDSNVEKFCDLVEEISSNVKTRFLVITHHPLTMARMDRLYGVTMQEKGVSQLVSVDLNIAEKIRNIA